MFFFFYAMQAKSFTEYSNPNPRLKNISLNKHLNFCSFAYFCLNVCTYTLCKTIEQEQVTGKKWTNEGSVINALPVK